MEFVIDIHRYYIAQQQQQMSENNAFWHKLYFTHTPRPTCQQIISSNKLKPHKLNVDYARLNALMNKMKNCNNSNNKM